MWFNDFMIFFFSINTFHNQHPSLNACVCVKFHILGRSKQIFGLQCTSKSNDFVKDFLEKNNFRTFRTCAVWNSLLERFLVVWRPQMRPERQPQGGTTNHEYHLSRALIPIQSQFGLWDSFLNASKHFLGGILTKIHTSCCHGAFLWTTSQLRLSSCF